MRKGILTVGLIALALTASGTPLVLSQMQTPSDEPSTTPSADVDTEQLRMEITLLRAINDMDLSQEQLQTLHTIVADLRSSRDQMVNAQRSLREFLVQFKGSREEYRQAVRSHDQGLEEARAAFRESWQDALERVTGTLTIRQGQILRRHLGEPERVGALSGRRAIRGGPGQDRPERRMPIGRQNEDCLTDRLGESMEQLRDRMGEMMDRFGIDGRMLPELKEEWEAHVVCPPQQGERPQLGVRLNVNVERIRDLMIDHLDTLEKVLREKLSAMSAQASASSLDVPVRRTLLTRS